jgi:hypothetical protein
MRTAAIACMTLALIASSCSSSNSDRPRAANAGNYYAVKTGSTDFFRYGPQQGNGPDQKLPHDTLMTLIRPSFGYAKVKLITGEQGFVASDDIQKAPQTLIAAVTATPTPAPVPVSYPEPKLPTAETPPGFEPTPIPAPPGARN